MFKKYKDLSREVYVIALSKLVASIGAFIWPLFVVILRSKTDMDEKTLTVLLSMMVFINIAASITGGFLSDKLGRKIVIVIFELLGMLSYILIIVFPVGMTTAVLLMIGMTFFGVAWPAHDALLANVTSTKEREVAYGLGYMATNLGIVFGPTLGGFLIKDHFTLFIVIDVLTTFMGWLLLVLLVKEPNLDKEQENVLEESTSKSMFSIIKERPVIFYYGILLLLTAVVYGQMDFTLQLYFESLFTNYEKLFGFMFGFNGLVVIVLTPLITYRLAKLKSMTKIFAGLVLYAVSMVIYSQATVMIGLFVAMFVFTLGEVIITVGSGPVMSKLVPGNMMARASSIIGIFYTIGHLIAINIPGYLLSNDYGFEFTWLVIVGIAILGIIYLLWFGTKYSDTLNYIDDFEANRK